MSEARKVSGGKRRRADVHESRAAKKMAEEDDKLSSPGGDDLDGLDAGTDQIGDLAPNEGMGHGNGSDGSKKRRKHVDTLPWNKVENDKSTSVYLNDDSGGTAAVFGVEEISAGSYEIINGKIVMKGFSTSICEDKHDQGAGSDNDEKKEEPAKPKLTKQELRKLAKQRRKLRLKEEKKKKREEEAKAKTDGESQGDGQDDDVEKKQKKRSNNRAERDKRKRLEKKQQARQKKARVVNHEEKGEGEEKREAEETDRNGRENGELNMQAWSEFGLHDDVVGGLERLKYVEPTPIQRMCLPKALGGSDILGAAETGSGKTLAFGLPIVSSLLSSEQSRAKEMGLYALVITPTRELAVQIVKHLEDILQVANAQAKRVKIGSLLGGMAVPKQKRVLSQRPDIVVATPGRLWAMIQDGEEHLRLLNDTLRFLVVDEADRMFEGGHFPDLKPLVETLSKNPSDQEGGKPRTVKRQTFLFSATLQLVAPEKTKYKTGDRLPKANSKRRPKKSALVLLMEAIGLRGKAAVCSVVPEANSNADQDTAAAAAAVVAGGSALAGRKMMIPSKLTLCSVECLDKAKNEYLYYFLTQYTGRCLVFVNTIASLRRVSDILKLLQVKNVHTLHANLQQRQRLKHLERFTAEPQGVLVATDVAARGLDIKGIDYVIQHGIPDSTESFVHRSGRTARANTQGLCLALVGPSEVRSFAKITNAIGEDRFEDFSISMTYMPRIKERLALARRIEVLERKRKASTSEIDWFVKNAKAADIMLGDEVAAAAKEEDRKKAMGASADLTSQEREARSLRKRLVLFLQEEIVPHFASTRYINPETNDLHNRLLQGKERDAREEVHKLAKLSKAGKKALVTQ